MDSKHIIPLQGKDFILFAGLLEIAHEQGLSSVNTEVIQLEPVVVIKATVTTSKGTFTGIGDASENNVNRMIAPHKIRMAETRAVARALRFATNIGMTALEELGGEEIKEVKTEPKESVPIKQNDTILNEFGGTVVPEELISEGQAKRLFAISKEAGWTNEEVKTLLNGYSYSSSRDIKKSDYKKICETIEADKRF